MAKKANGKARARKRSNGKAKKVSEHEIGLIPLSGKLTPARAKRWLEEEYEGYHELAELGLTNATNRDERDAFGWLSFNVVAMVKACMEALDGVPVVLESELYGPFEKKVIHRFSHIQSAITVLRLPAIAAADIDNGSWLPPESDAYGEIARGVAHFVELAVLQECKASHEAILQRNAEHEANRPGKPPKGYEPQTQVTHSSV